MDTAAKVIIAAVVIGGGFTIYSLGKSSAPPATVSNSSGISASTPSVLDVFTAGLRGVVAGIGDSERSSRAAELPRTYGPADSRNYLPDNYNGTQAPFRT